MCIGGQQTPVENLAKSMKNTRDNVNSLFGWGNPGTRGETKSGNITNIYNYGSDSSAKNDGMTKRASLGVKGGVNTKGSLS